MNGSKGAGMSVKKNLMTGDIVYVKTADGYAVEHLFPHEEGKSPKTFRILPPALSASEVRDLGINPDTAELFPASLRLRLTHGDDYWCIILEDNMEDQPIRMLGKVPDEAVSKIFYSRTKGSPFMDLSYDDIKLVRRNVEEKIYREKMLKHVEDTRAIRGLLSDILAELRKEQDTEKKSNVILTDIKSDKESVIRKRGPKKSQPE